MSERKVRIVKDFLGSFYRTKDEYLFHCPKCKHHRRKLSVNFDKNVFKCWICDYVGKDISRLVYSYGSQQNKSDWKSVAGVVDFSREEDKEEKISVTLPQEFSTLTSSRINPLALEPMRYIKKRNISRSDLVWWKIGYCPDGDYSKRIVIPSFDLNGELNYFIARSYAPGEWQKYKNPPAAKDFIFNELYLDWDKDVVLVEGVFDAIVARNAIPLLGSTLRENSYIFQKIVSKCDKIYIALDQDAKQKEDKISQLFMSYGVDVYRIDTSGFDDVGEMDKETYKSRKNNAKIINMDNYLLEKLMF